MYINISRMYRIYTHRGFLEILWIQKTDTIFTFFSFNVIFPNVYTHAHFPTVVSFSTQSCRPSFLSAYISVDSQHVVPASLRRHVGISVHIGCSRRIDATSQLRRQLMTSITLAHFWLLLQSRYSRCRNQGGLKSPSFYAITNILSIWYGIISDVGFFLKV